MKTASENLTPVSLECGGKSPCIVDSNCDLDVSVKRIAWGKFLNSGQTCIAPDYVLCHKKVLDQFLLKMKSTIIEFYSKEPEQSKDYGKIISVAHVRRLKDLIEDKPYFPETEPIFNEKERFISPILLLNPKKDSKVMKDEIFGPILPIISVESCEDAFSFILSTNEKPLAAYLFSNDSSVQNKFISKISSGGMLINDTIMHCICDELPFGGVGSSGMGSYNGRKTFDEFTHRKSVLIKSTFGDVNFRYPPYNESKISTLKFLQTFKFGKYLKMFLIIPILSILLYFAYSKFWNKK